MAFRLLAIFLATFISLTAFAQTSSNEIIDFTIHQQYISARAMGMGNAFVAVADDYSAMFYNPAGLARLDKWQMNFEIRAGLDKDILPFIDEMEAAGKTSGTADDIAVIERNYGQHYSLRAPTVGWYWVWPRWGFAIIPADLTVDIKLSQKLGPALGLKVINDTTMAASFARNVKWLGKHRFSWGTTVKAIYRGAFARQVHAADFALDPKVVNFDQANEGITADLDVGLLYSPDYTGGFWRWARYTRPTFGLAVRNAADYGFIKDLNLYNKADPGEPPKLGRRVDFGTMWELPDWWIFKSRFAFDIRDMGDENWTLRKGLHAGAEFKWRVAGWWLGGWRAGLNQGYWTLGFTGKLGVFMLDLVSYGEEVGSSETKQENRIFMAKTSLDF